MPFPKIFNRKKYTKKLNLQEMWGLYRTLKDGLVREREKYFMDEIIHMMNRIDVELFKSSLRRMYGEISDNPLEAALLFSKGLKDTNFFGFVEFVETLSGSTK